MGGRATWNYPKLSVCCTCFFLFKLGHGDVFFHASVCYATLIFDLKNGPPKVQSTK